jgi:hypothetical protein
LHSGLLTFSSSLGAMLVRTFSGWFLRVFGFRHLFAGNSVLAAAVTAAAACCARTHRSGWSLRR